MNKEHVTGAEERPAVLFKNAHLVDPAAGLDKKADILVSGGVIDTIGSVIESSFDGLVIDCSGKHIVPGFFDMHVHFREPGYETAETLESGMRAAVAGGFTGVAVMPNTDPACDNSGQVNYIKKRTEDKAVDVYPIGAVTKGRKGEELTEMADMKEAGAVAFSDDGVAVKNAKIMRNAIEYASMIDTVIIDHCEDPHLSADGVMNESFVSTTLGMNGIPSISEEIIVARDIAVAEYIGKPVHLAHISTARSVEIIRDAKKRGVKVTAETCPHYLVLTEKELLSFNTNMKMNPPLRGEKDRDALIAGVKDGTIDAIVTDHAPHVIDKKEQAFNVSAFGIIGLETALGVLLTKMVHEGELTLKELIRLYAINPRSILGIKQACIEKGQKANITILDMEKEWTIDKETFLSRARNTPFDQWKVKGKAVGVYNNNKLHYQP